MRWEHKLVEFQPTAKMFGIRFDLSKVEHELHRLGDDGWELVSLTGIHQLTVQTSVLVASLKRPRRDVPDTTPS